MKREQYIPEQSVVVSHRRQRGATSSLPCIVGQHIRFDADVLKSFFTRGWEPIIYDALLLVAVIEFCDRVKKRPSMDWPRHFSVSMPVHDPDHWNDQGVQATLVRALEFLTGDRWLFSFRPVHRAVDARPQELLQFDSGIEAVIPFSDGLDSLAMSTILNNEIGDKLIKVRIGASHQRRTRQSEAPFAAIPFKVSPRVRGNQESSCRSRGFKFAMLSGIAAYMARARIVVVPESGQGALGSVLVNVGHAHPDRRTHPQLTQLVSAFLKKLLDHHINFDHRALWGTKAETLAMYHTLKPGDDTWRQTRSCWQDARHASVNGTHKQCGICAACLIRRLSLHAAGLEESPDTYVWNKLDTSDFWKAADPAFSLRHDAYREYGLAGVLHLDHLATLPAAPQYDSVVERQALRLSYALGIDQTIAKAKIIRLVEQHAREWRAFLEDLAKESFLRQWADAA